MEKKIILLDTNLNNKIGCGFLVHIMKAAGKALTPEQFKQVITFKAGDAAADYQLWDYTKDVIKKIHMHLVALSHGTIQRDEFEQLLYEKHGLHAKDEAGVYFFKRVTE